MYCFLALSAALFATSSAFLFPMAGGGGGGGCGCAPPPPAPCCAPPPPPPPPPPPACCAPPPPSCGCGCGRKKRSIEDKSVEGIVEYNNPSSDIIECNSSQLRQILDQNMQSIASDSLKSLQSALAQDFDSDDHLVICSKDSINFAAPRGTKYCTARKSNHICQIYSMTD